MDHRRHGNVFHIPPCVFVAARRNSADGVLFAEKEEGKERLDDKPRARGFGKTVKSANFGNERGAFYEEIQKIRLRNRRSGSRCLSRGFPFRQSVILLRYAVEI